MIMENTTINSILICGHGLAGQMALSALSLNLAEHIKITYLDLEGTPNFDALYGSSLRPTAYDFCLNIGLSEPKLLRSTSTSFSYGSGYKNWGGQSWIQSFHLPFPIWDNVPFHHYLAKQGKDIEPYVVSALAAKAGVFAHPPKDPKIPLSRAEYGYHISPAEITDLLASKDTPENVSIIKGTIKHITHGPNGEIRLVTLESGNTISADLYVDCSGPNADLLSSFKSQDISADTLVAFVSHISSGNENPPISIIRCGDYGWQSDSPLRDSVTRLTITHPETETAARKDHGREPDSTLTYSPGKRREAWIKNCVGIGQSVMMLSPLTPAPLMLLQKDIERLIELIPVTDNMDIERRESNQRFRDDAENIKLFHDAFYASDKLPDGPYWNAVKNKPVSEKLARKLVQFESRGYFVPFDFEGFNQEDWTILHFGMGRRPDRYDVKIDQMDNTVITKQLSILQMACETIVTKMPPHDRYLSNYLKFLEKKNGS